MNVHLFAAVAIASPDTAMVRLSIAQLDLQDTNCPQYGTAVRNLRNPYLYVLTSAREAHRKITGAL